MDSPVMIAPLPPTAPHRKHSTTFWIFFWVVFVSAVIMGAFLIEKYSGRELSLGNSLKANLLITLIGPSGLELYSIDTKTSPASLKTFTPSNGPAVPADSFISDTASSPLHSYYFVTNRTTEDTGVFEYDAAGGAIPGAHEIISSKTYKFGVSYDAGSNTLAYLSIDPKTISASTSDSVWNVVIATPGLTTSSATKVPVTPIVPSTATSTTEKVIAKGQNVFLLSGGLYALVEEGNQLAFVNTKTGTSQNVLTIDPEAPLAVDPTTDTLALYNEKSQVVQYFNIKSLPSVSYLSSVKPDITPQQMVYTNGSLLLAGINIVKGEKTNLVITFAGKTAPVAQVPLSSAPPVLIGPLLLQND